MFSYSIWMIRHHSSHWRKEIYPPSQNAPSGRTGMNAKRGIHRSFSVGGYASAGFAEAVKMPRAEARGIFTCSRLPFLSGVAESTRPEDRWPLHPLSDRFFHPGIGAGP